MTPLTAGGAGFGVKEADDMNEHPEPQLIFACAADRRFWLLRKALERLPLDQAIELARTAEGFITEAAAGVTVPTRAQHRVAEPVVAKKEIALAKETAEVSSASTSGPEVREARKQSHLPLSKEQREELLGRMAKGAKNAELAGDYGLNPRQVQGIRMGSGREIAKRRARLNAGPASPEGWNQLRRRRYPRVRTPQRPASTRLCAI
jgi:hypothetical protein